MNKKYLLIGSCFLLLFLFLFCKGPKVNDWVINKPPTKFEQMIFFGDSLTSGYGLDNNDLSFPNLIQQKLNIPIEVYGYPGDTTADGLKKESLLELEPPSLLILTLGGNDILRQIKPEQTGKNLKSLIKMLKSRGHTVVFTEVLSIVAGKRHQIYIDVCKEMNIAMVPNILAGVITDVNSMQIDGIHPNETGNRKIAAKIITTLQEIGFVD